MKCISVYTDKFDVFSDVYEVIRQIKLKEDEETVIHGVVVSESGIVPEHYVDKMRARRDVAIMKDDDITIFQRGSVFEIFLPEEDTIIQ